MKKPCIGIIFSSIETDSQESIRLAQYIGCQLCFSGYSYVYYIEYDSKQSPKIADKNSFVKLSFSVDGGTKVNDSPSSDYEVAYWDVLPKCDVILVTVNSEDTKLCAIKLTQILNDSKDIVIFSLQRGVMNTSILKSEFSNKNGCIILDGVINFSVASHPTNKALTPSVPTPSILLPRLSKDIVKIADGPVSLIENTNMMIYYKKNLTPSAWGLLLVENIYALNVLTNGTVPYTLSKWKWRVIYATMIREGLQTLTVAARGGGWKPDVTLITILTPKWIEMILITPTPIFTLLAWIFRIQFTKIPSTFQLDILSHRKTTIDSQLSELISAGKRHGIPMPVSLAVLDHIKTLEQSSIAGPTSNYNSHLNTQTQAMSVIENMVFKKTPPSVLEFRIWLLKFCCVLCIIFFIYLLLIRS